MAERPKAKGKMGKANRPRRASEPPSKHEAIMEEAANDPRVSPDNAGETARAAVRKRIAGYLCKILNWSRVLGWSRAGDGEGCVLRAVREGLAAECGIDPLAVLAMPLREVADRVELLGGRARGPRVANPMADAIERSWATPQPKKDRYVEMIALLRTGWFDTPDFTLGDMLEAINKKGTRGWNPEDGTGNVVLRGRDVPPIVMGKEKALLSNPEYDIITVLWEASREGKKLTKDQLDLKSQHTDSRKFLYALAKKDPGWSQVIALPGTHGRGYSIRLV